MFLSRMRIQFKQKCVKCKTNYVLTTSSRSYVICYDCQKDSLMGEITDPVYKKLFNIPEEYYKTNAFLRNIKANYLKYKNLTEKQILAFKKTVEKIRKDS